MEEKKCECGDRAYFYCSECDEYFCYDCMLNHAWCLNFNEMERLW